MSLYLGLFLEDTWFCSSSLSPWSQSPLIFHSQLLWQLLVLALVFQDGELSVGLGPLFLRGTSAAELALQILNCYMWVWELPVLHLHLTH